MGWEIWLLLFLGKPKAAGLAEGNLRASLGTKRTGLCGRNSV